MGQNITPPYFKATPLLRRRCCFLGWAPFLWFKSWHETFLTLMWEKKQNLADLVAGRPPLGKMAYRRRIINTCRTRKAKQTAARLFTGLRKVCQEVLDKKGAMARG